MGFLFGPRTEPFVSGHKDELKGVLGVRVHCWQCLIKSKLVGISGGHRTGSAWWGHTWRAALGWDEGHVLGVRLQEGALAPALFVRFSEPRVGMGTPLAEPSAVASLAGKVA